MVGSSFIRSTQILNYMESNPQLFNNHDFSLKLYLNVSDFKSFGLNVHHIQMIPAVQKNSFQVQILS